MSLHLTDADGQLVCPEALERDAMDDGQFWDHIAGNLLAAEPEPYDDSPQDDDIALDDPCTVCGAPGACAWDAEGRPLIHAGETDDT